MTGLATWLGVALRRVSSLLLLAVGSIAAASCLAQESYHRTSGAAGSSGAGSTGTGGLTLNAPGDAGTSGEASSAGTSAVMVRQCSTSDQCAMPYPYCVPATGQCAECLSSINCVGTGRSYCNGQTNTCVVCLNNTQCRHSLPYCEQGTGQCVECLSSENCGSSDFACDRDTFRCVPACRSHSDCAATLATPFCDPERSVCVACLADDGCPAKSPRCALDTKTCEECLGDDDCSSPTPLCDLHTHACAECLSDRDCQIGAQCVSGVCAQPR